MIKLLEVEEADLFVQQPSQGTQLSPLDSSHWSENGTMGGGSKHKRLDVYCLAFSEGYLARPSFAPSNPLARPALAPISPLAMAIFGAARVFTRPSLAPARPPTSPSLALQNIDMAQFVFRESLTWQVLQMGWSAQPWVPRGPGWRCPSACRSSQSWWWGRRWWGVGRLPPLPTASGFSETLQLAPEKIKEGEPGVKERKVFACLLGCIQRNLFERLTMLRGPKVAEASEEHATLIGGRAPKTPFDRATRASSYPKCRQRWCGVQRVNDL